MWKPDLLSHKARRKKCSDLRKPCEALMNYLTTSRKNGRRSPTWKLTLALLCTGNRFALVFSLLDRFYEGIGFLRFEKSCINAGVVQLRTTIRRRTRQSPDDPQVCEAFPFPMTHFRLGFAPAGRPGVFTSCQPRNLRSHRPRNARGQSDCRSFRHRALALCSKHLKDVNWVHFKCARHPTRG